MKLALHFALCLLMLPGTGAQAQAERPAYHKREAEPATGSHLKRNKLSSPKVAVNLPYEQLPEADKAALRSLYTDMPEGDEPPFPLAGTQALLDPLQQAHAKLLAKGSLVAYAMIDSQGKVQSVEVLQSPDPQMTRFVGGLLILTPFKPARCGGRACAMEYLLNVEFKVY